MKGIANLTLSDTNQNVFTKNLPNVNPEYLPDFGSDISVASASSIKSACQSLNSLTTNTLRSINLTTTIDITNVEGEGNG